MMARKPNYDFERKERDRLKAEKKAKRAAEKQQARDEKSRQGEAPGEDGSQGAGEPTSS
jgi:hypothetical protein